jgi:hypothetical protein
MPRGKLIALNASIGKVEKSKISDLDFHFKKLANEEQIKPKESRKEKRSEKSVKNKIDNQMSTSW